MELLKSLTIPCTFYLLVITPTTVNSQQNSDTNSSLIIETNSGRVCGLTITSSTGKEVDTWLGIPFAEKPSGDLRFRLPEPVRPWDGILDATQNPNSCVQAPNIGDEDCLYLSITAPKPRPTHSAVMVWIHGGAFIGGSHTSFDYTIMASEENIILVGINYRVASLGFLAFGTVDAPGNVGLFDQSLALKWIHDNIAAFGGDPNQITVFGESAGSMSISLHLLSPHSRGLFSKAILESGSADAPQIMPSLEAITERGLYVANAVGCPHDRSNIREVIDCLKNTSALSLVNNEPLSTMPFFEVPFSAIVDGNFVPQDPGIILDNRNFENVSILAGANSAEGFYFVMDYFTNLFGNGENISLNRTQFFETLDVANSMFNTKVKNAILVEYTNWDDPDDTFRNLDALDKVVGDSRFTCPTVKVADRFLDAGNDVYVYHFTHMTSKSPFPPWVGAIHSEEIAYVFGQPLNPLNNYPNDEIGLSRRMLKYWTNFAKTGNPNTSPDGSVTEIEWPIRTSTGREYLELNVNTSTTGRGPRAKQCVFWDYYIPQLNDPNEDTDTNGQESTSRRSFLAVAVSIMAASFFNIHNI